MGIQYIYSTAGTDSALALGMLHVIAKENLYDKEFVEKWTKGFDRRSQLVNDYPPERVEEITWMRADTVRNMAHIYFTAKAAFINPRNSLDQHKNASCGIRVIHVLMVIIGNLDIRGGNLFSIPVSMSFENLKLFHKLPPEQIKKIGAEKALWSKISHTWPTAHTPSLWDAIPNDDPNPVRAMMVMASNPVIICANSKVAQEASKGKPSTNKVLV